MTEQLRFVVTGSKGTAYQIEAWRDGRNLTMTCTCRAGQVGRHCKHRVALLYGDVTALQSGNIRDVERLRDLLAGSDVEPHLTRLTALQQRKADVDAEIKRETSALARTLND